MTTLERLARLCSLVGVPVRFSRLHDTLDELDKHVGIITSHGRRSVYGVGANAPLTQEYVGARIRRLERHVLSYLNEPARPYFWLGAKAERKVA